jgi:hypothetical protein
MTETHVAHRTKESPGEAPQGGRHRLGKVILDEVRTLIPAWAFFFLVFLLLRLTRTEILRESHISKFPPSRVLIGSIIMAKGILLVDLIPLVKKTEKYPLLGAACLKSLAYFVVAFLFEYVEGVLDFRHEGYAAASRQFGRSLGSPVFWLLQVWLVFSIFLYSATRELAQKLGPKRFRELVFGRSSPS